MTNIKWTGKRGDYTAHVDGYTLRLQKLEGIWWWWCGNPDGTQKGEYVHDKSLNDFDVKNLAIEAMNEHRNKQ